MCIQKILRYSDVLKNAYVCCIFSYDTKLQYTTFFMTKGIFQLIAWVADTYTYLHVAILTVNALH